MIAHCDRSNFTDFRMTFTIMSFAQPPLQILPRYASSQTPSPRHGLSRAGLLLSFSALLFFPSACGGGGGGSDSDVFVGFSEGTFAGATDYQLTSVSGTGGTSICNAGLDGLYRENPLGYRIAPSTETPNSGRLSVTKLGKGSPVGEVSASQQTLSYEENFGANQVPGTNIFCAANNQVTLNVITSNRIDAVQSLTFSCTDSGGETLCNYEQNAVLARQ